MASGQPTPAVSRGMQQLFGPGPVTGLAEWQLLHRFAAHGDEAAFEALIARHGPMVLGVCRRILREPADVDDAFQATFLVLVRKASSLGERDHIGRWLRGVALRVARRARSDAARRRTRERPGSAPDLAASTPAGDDPESSAIVRDEVRKLPETYRWAVTLCDLDGLTHEQAARELRWPIGTVKGRLSRARERLKLRLIRRGLAPSAALLSPALARDAPAAVPAALKALTLAAARALSSRDLPTVAISARVASLTRSSLRALMMTKLQATAAATLLAFGLLGGGGGLLARQGKAPEPAAPERARTGPPDPGGAIVETKTADVEARPMPPEPAPPDQSKAATPSASSSKSRTQLDVARDIYEDLSRHYAAGRYADVDNLERWSRRIAQAQIDSGDSSPAALKAAVGDHITRMRHVADLARRSADANHTPKALDAGVLYALYNLGEAEAWLERERRGDAPQVSTTAPAPGSGRAPQPGATDAKSRAILAALDQPIAIPFESETPLEDVVKYIKQATADNRMPGGLPIYVDPEGLQRHKRTMTSPVALNLEGVPLKTSLALLLKQLDLKYVVRDGLLQILSKTDDMAPADLPDPTVLPYRQGSFHELHRKFERRDITLAELKQLKELIILIREVEHLEANPQEVPSGTEAGTARGIKK